MYLTQRYVLSETKHPRFPRIISPFTDTSASTYYRQQVPFTGMALKHLPVSWGPLEAFESLTRNRPQLYDMVVICRTGNGHPQEIIEAIRSEQALGHVVILDYDDDILHIPEHNPGHHDNTDGILAAITTADGVVVTNPTLGSVLSQYNPNVGVVPNYVDVGQWRILPTFSASGKIRIGLFGSPTHFHDWELAAKPLREIYAEFSSRIKIVCACRDFPTYLEGIAHHIKPRPLANYAEMLRGLHIGLAPLVDDAFNRCKSPIKAYEYALAGAAVIASPTQYRTVVQGRGRIARNEQEWYAALREYIVHEETRAEDAKAIHLYVRKHIDVGAHAGEIAAVYKGLYDRAVKQNC